jgi:Mn-containing catalase
MTREIAHFQQFSAALATIEPNFPPGVMQGDLRFTHTYYNMSNGTEDARGPWNKGKGPWPKGEEWEYVEDPTSQVEESQGQSTKEPIGHQRDPQDVLKIEKALAAQRSSEAAVTSGGEQCWSLYGETPTG